MQNSKKIFGLLAPEAKEKVKEMLLNKESADVIRDYLEKLSTKKSKVLSSIGKKFRIKSKGKVIAYVDSSDYTWMIYNGENVKEIPYLGMTVILKPKYVFGIFNKDGENNRVIIPNYKKVPITLDTVLIEDLIKKSNPFYGDISLIFNSKNK